MLKELLLIMLPVLPAKADLLLYIAVFKLFPLFPLSNAVCVPWSATDGLFCCVKHFVGGQLYIMRGKTKVKYM